MSSREKTYELLPDWRMYLVPFIIGAVLTPFIIGIWIIYHYYKKHKQRRYHITDSRIIILENETRATIPLYDILSVDIKSTWIGNKFNFGDIVLHLHDDTATLWAITDPGPIASLIEKAAASEHERIKVRNEVEQTRPQHPTGTLENKNELVGLWQQGLISEDDYKREIEKFK